MQTQLSAREAMVVSQLRTTKVNDPALVAALKAVPREHFVPDDRRASAYADEDVPLGAGRVMLQPLTIARLLNEAEIQAGGKVLVIGAGTGYACAVLDAMGAKVTGLEQDAALAERARASLAAAGHAAVTVVEGALEAGYPASAPYDAIVVNGATEFLPQAWAGQLAAHGVVVAILKQDGVGRGVVARAVDGVFGCDAFMDAFTPVLPGLAKPVTFQF